MGLFIEWSLLPYVMGLSLSVFAQIAIDRILDTSLREIFRRVCNCFTCCLIVTFAFAVIANRIKESRLSNGWEMSVPGMQSECGGDSDETCLQKMKGRVSLICDSIYGNGTYDKSHVVAEETDCEYCFRIEMQTGTNCVLKANKSSGKITLEQDVR